MRVVLVSPGSFNPPTYMHLRMFGESTSRPVLALLRLSSIHFIRINFILQTVNSQMRHKRPEMSIGVYPDEV